MCSLKTVSPNTLLNKQSFVSQTMTKSGMLNSQISLTKLTPVINKSLYASPVKMDSKMRKANSEKRVKQLNYAESNQNSTRVGSDSNPSDFAQTVSKPPSTSYASTRNSKLPKIYSGAAE